MGKNTSENVIVIEGFSGVGKTTTAQKLAAELGYAFIDSGLLYRAFSLHLIRHNYELIPKEVYKALDFFEPHINKDGTVILEGHDVTHLLHEQQVTEIVSTVSSAQFVRKKINNLMKEFSMRHEGRVVITGRSTAAEVFPETRLIFDLQASAEIRAMRRFEQQVRYWSGEGIEPNYEEILLGLKRRDFSDINKPVMPMAINEQAFIINTEELDLEQVVSLISNEVRLRLLRVEGVIRREKERF